MADYEGRLSPCLEDFEDEALDPRIQGELERLNRASEEINRLELELDDARASFRQALSDSTHKLDGLAKKLGSSVEKARPYYDARHRSKEVHVETQKAAYMYERACSMHEAAKEMVQLAEQGYMQREDTSDAAWQEMLNHATMKVNDAERERLDSEKVHQQTMYKFKEAEDRVQKLQKDLKRAINKSRPYFEMKAKFNQMMEDRKKSVNNLESSVNDAKKNYSEALRNLEEISEEIHRQRLEMKNQAELGIRGAGVGSESPSPPPMRGKEPLSIDGKTSHLTSGSEIGRSPTASTQSFVASTTSHNMALPSVIYSSAEKARSRSYRQAIDSDESTDNTSERQILDSISEDYRVDVEDEYLSLPSTSSDSSSKGQRSSDKSGNNLVFDENHYGQRSQIVSSASKKIGGLNHSASSDSNQLATQPQPKVKKPSTKLKGLILLPVGAGQDPLQVNSMINTVSHKPSSKVLRQRSEPGSSRPPTYPYSQKTVAHKVMSPTSQSYTRGDIPAKDIKRADSKDSLPELPTPGSEKSVKRLLKVPSYQDFEEGSVSDTESITSGPMLDDDQVEFLTMDFSEQVLDDNEEHDEDIQDDWRMMSLPSNLSHLESYIRRYSETFQPKDLMGDNTEEKTRRHSETFQRKDLTVGEESQGTVKTEEMTKQLDREESDEDN